MLIPPSTRSAEALRQTLWDHGYTGERVQSLAGNLDPPIPGTPRWHRLEGELDPAVPGDALVLWFFLGAALRSERVAGFPPPFLEAVRETGLLRDEGGWSVPQVLLAPVLGLWIASDRFRAPAEAPPYGDVRADGGPELSPDPVLGVGPAPIHADRFALRTPVRTVLDLCAGGGILTLSQLPTAETITATDLSARALGFARFNLALNATSARRPDAGLVEDAGAPSEGIDRTVELLEGDLFAPVAGRRFDRIVCNPPFILMPSGPVGLSGARDTAADSAGAGSSIDSFCERIVRSAPDHLEEGGTFQMIFEWPEHVGEDWRDRLGHWVRGSGCDAWFVHANQQSPVAYVEARVREMEALGATEPLATRFRRWTGYFRDHEVEMLHGGFLLLRRREAERNWIRFDEIEGDLVGHASEEIEAALARFDLVESLEEGAEGSDPLAGLRLRTSASLVAGPAPSAAAGSGVRDDRGFVRLQTGRGWVRRVTVQPEIATFVRRFDGGCEVRQAITSLADDMGAPTERIAPEVARVVRGLFEKGFLEPGMP